MGRTLRYVQWVVGVVWFLSWFALYLEIYRYRHVAAPDFPGHPQLDPIVALGHAGRGHFVQTVLACSVAAPLMFVLLIVGRWAIRFGHREPPLMEPQFPIVPVLMGFGIGLCLLGILNQLIRRAPITMDLTLRTGNGGFVALGLALAAGGLVARAVVRH